MAKERRSEQELYPLVSRFLKRRYGCFATGHNKGTNYGRVDVVGLRDVGRDLSGAFEVIGVEVKAGYQPFSTAAGQAYGYSVYANRCYLADLRPGARSYSLEETDIASSLGVGLLAISGSTVKEVRAAPVQTPLESRRLELVDKLGYSLCTLCHSLFFRTEEGRYSQEVSRAGLKKAAQREKGIVYWLNRLNERKRDKRNLIYQRRYLCADCVMALSS